MCDKNNTDNKEFVLSENEQKEFDLYLKNLVINKDKHFNFGSLKIAYNFLIRLASISTIFGVITGYTYLSFINQLSLFSDMINGFSVFIAIAIVYCILALLIGICFVAPLLTSFLIRDIYNNHHLNIRFLILQFLFLTIGFFPYFLMLLFRLSSHFLWFIFGSAVLISALNGLIIKYSDNKSNYNDFDVVFLILAISIFQHYPILLTVYPISDFSNTIFDEWMFFLLIPSINILMYFISFLVIAVIPTKNFNFKNMLFTIFGVFFVSYFLLFSVMNKAPYQSLYVVSFIQKPKNSSWYLIHNGNTASETINGMNSSDIENKKRIFNNKNCNDDWCEDDVSVILEQRQNALYGYMAWNLGDTKVFCPASVDFFDGTDNTEKSKKCLVIDGRYLQLTSNYYIGNAITQ